MTENVTTVVLAATEMECRACRPSANMAYIVSGVGLVPTALATIEAIRTYNPKLLIQIGIAGAISHDLALGEVVQVASDYYGDLGAWRGDHFESFTSTIYQGTPCAALRKARGITVNIAGNPLINRDNADVESMEGAAFLHTAYAQGVPAIELRSISNYLDTPRNEWRINQALASLPDALDLVIDTWLQAQK